MTWNLFPLVIIAVVLFVVLNLAAGLIWVERRLLALWQDRYGPNRVGPFGLGQVVADSVKMFTKEDWVPPFADRPVFVLAPAIIVATALLSFAVVPFSPGFVVADLDIGVLFLLAMSSLGVYSVVLAGWASNNKYSLLGGIRAAAQMLSYEVFMGLSLRGVVRGASIPRIRSVPDRGRGGDAPSAIRSSGSGERIDCRLSLRVFGYEVRHVLRRGIYRRDPDLGNHCVIVFRWLVRNVVTGPGLV